METIQKKIMFIGRAIYNENDKLVKRGKEFSKG